MKDTVINIVKKADFDKEFKGEEFEIKFSLQGKPLPKMECLNRIIDTFEEQGRYEACHVYRGDRLSTDVKFFFYKDREYTFFKYRKALVVKIKKHIIIESQPYNYFRNLERLIIDKKDYYSKLIRFKKRFEKHDTSIEDLSQFRIPQKYALGNMQKDRVKDFVIDTLCGRIYAVAITICKSKSDIQRQLEIEYAGYIPGFRGFKINDQNQIILGVQEVSKFIHTTSDILLIPTTETKQEFVRKNV